MAETIRAFVGVKDVSFAVAGSGTRSVSFLDRLDEETSRQNGRFRGLLLVIANT